MCRSTNAGRVVDVTPFDERIPTLLLIGVLAIVWLGISAPAAGAAAVAPAIPSGPESLINQLQGS